jgi:hypothetical protein
MIDESSSRHPTHSIVVIDGMVVVVVVVVDLTCCFDMGTF